MTAMHRTLAALVAVIATSACAHARLPGDFRAAGAAPVEADAALAARVKAALSADPYVNDIHVEVSVDQGNVVLTGLVEDNRALLDALHVAKKAARGRKVIDEMSIVKTSVH